MEKLLPLAEKAAALLKARNQTIAVAESSAGGLINAALLAFPGASAYCKGGMVMYTRDALLGLRDVTPDMLITHSGCRWVLDTKWKRLDTDAKARNYDLSQSDFYQLYALAR